MDRTKFGSSATGKPLPRAWEIPNSLWPLLASAREELARLDGIGRTLPRPELLLRPLQQREALRSSSLEGTYATADELLLFELAPEDRFGPADRVNDWREVLNYAAAVRIGTEFLAELPLSLRLIRTMHQELLTGVRGRDRAPGEFRRTQVQLGSDRRYMPPPVNELLPCLDDFERFLNDADAIDPLIRTFIAHYQFEAIHPFIDGNGRVGRALLSLCAYKWCGLSHPWLYVSPYFDRHKDEYIDSLFAVSTDGAWSRWLELCLRATIDVCRDAVRRCAQLAQLRAEYHSRAGTTNGRMHVLIDDLFSNPFVRVTEASKRMNVSYPTARDDIEKLVKLEILVELEGSRPKAFYSPAIFNAAYREE
jgi:Fic family protein